MAEVPQPASLQDPDLPLLRAMAAGDTGALNALYERHGRGLLAYLIGQLGNDRQLAEEILQDVMLAAWHGAEGFRAESKVRTWLFGIARRQAMNARRRRKPTPAPLPEALPGDDPEPIKELERRADRDDVRAALRELPDDQQEALELIFFHDMSGIEAADLLGVPVGTVKSRLHRAKTRLRRLLTGTTADLRGEVNQ